MHAYLLIAQNRQRLNYLKETLLEKLGLIAANEMLISKTDNSIETVRRIKKTLYIGMKTASKRTVVIERIDHFAPIAQNALLKILEEPPLDTTFILETENEHQVLPTIRSRTQIINDKTRLQPQPASSTVFKSFWMEIFRSNSIGIRLTKASEIASRYPAKEEVDTWLKDQLVNFHNLLVSRVGDRANPNTRLLQPEQITKIIRELLKARQLLQGNINLKLLLDHLFINMPSTEK